MIPSRFDLWLQIRTMTDLSDVILLSLGEIQRRGLEPEIVWTGEQWVITTTVGDIPKTEDLE